ncbi:MAG: Hsp70 family protein [Prevotella sp.]|nr:Hsp70 family protein [Prevotella sp.]
MIQAHFSQIRSTLTKYIENSTSEICIAVAWFTHRDLFHSILSALDRKVKVSIILIDDIINRGPNGLDFATYIEKGGTIRFMNTRTLLMHNKFCVFDNQVLITGSYNWTYSAETRNAENIIVTDDINVCNAFNSQFSKLWRDLPEVEQFSHIEFKDITSEVLLNCFDYLHDEYESMEQAQILKSISVTDVDNLKKDISITRLNTIITNTKRAKPILKENISLEIVNNKTKIIIRANQDLPFTNTVDAKTVNDFQDAVNCNIRYGNYIDADKNQLLVNLRIENLPRLKAGEVTFLAKVTIDTNGYMHIEFVCINNGISKSAVYNAKDLINYQ